MPLAEIITTVKGAQAIFNVVKDAVSLIPDPVKKQTALAQLALLEKQLATQDAEFAKGLGYELCLGHFPPEIMLDTGEVWKCSVCGKTKLTAQGQEKENERELEKQRASHPIGGYRIGTRQGY